MKELIMIITMCTNSIEPRYDEDKCITMMFECTINEGVSFESCADYWEVEK